VSQPQVSVTVADLVAACEREWPASGAEDWDNTGLQVGRLSDTVTRVLFVVDVVDETVAQAIEGNFDAIVSHHPLILRGIATVSEATYKGELIARLIRNNIALLAMHTNADVVIDGVSDVIASQLGLVSAQPVIATQSENIGIGRVGTLSSAVTLGELASRLAAILPATVPGIQVAGEFTRQVQRVALCGGAGDSLLERESVQASDVYISSDLRHHRASESREQSRLVGGPALINVSHWASEWLWLDVGAAALSRHIPSLTIEVSDVRTDPWDFVVTQ
jgi:dinuclear metal center YbgI/SA1388 family protein